METDIQSQEVQERKNATGCLGELGWLVSGSVLPIVSFTYFRKASQRKVGTAILFFFIFTFVITLLSTVGVGVSMGSVTGEIRQGFEDGTIPEIIIRDGIAEVDAPGPVILFSGDTNGNETFVAIDTTGDIDEIDRYRYTQGFLLTRTALHVYNNGEYQVLPLRELHTAFDKNPIIINTKTATNAWQILTAGFTLIAFFFIFLWHSIIRLMILTLYALIMWGIISLIRPNTKFDPIIISALYAVVPAIYLSYLFSRIGIIFPGLQTFFFLPFWFIAMAASLSNMEFFSADQPPRLWTALIGLPMLVMFCIDKISQFPQPQGPIILWSVSALTVLILASLRLFFRFKKQQSNEPVQE